MAKVFVTCEGVEHQVFIDNLLQGLTDTPLSVPVGLHVVDLGFPVDYLPPFQEVFVDHEPDLTIVSFTPMAAFVARATKARKAALRARKSKPKVKSKAKPKAKAKAKTKAKAKAKTTSRAKRSCETARRRSFTPPSFMISSYCIMAARDMPASPSCS